MKKSFFEILINILLGASWALTLIGASIAFYIFVPFGLMTGLLSAFLGSLLGLFFVVVLETVALQFEKLREIKKQTTLLETIEKRISVHDTVSDY